MMNNLRRRIEKLELRKLAAGQVSPDTVDQALSRNPGNAELLIRALRAEREGRELSADEFRGKQAFRQAMIQVCGSSFREGFEDAVDISKVVNYAFMWNSHSEFFIVENFEQYKEEGAVERPHVSAARQKLDAEWNRLCSMAGSPVSEGTTFTKAYFGQAKARDLQKVGSK